MTFVWAPNKGEKEEDYMKRVFEEHPQIGIRDLLKARNTLRNPVLTPSVAPTPKAPAPRNDARELELERENARLRLQVNSLTERLTMLQRMLKNTHQEMLDVHRDA